MDFFSLKIFYNNMNKLTIETVFHSYNEFSELPLEIQKVMNSAIEARDNAYAPYSKFQVGAAVLLHDGTIVKGSNQENAAFPSGLCAERTAIFSVGANYPKHQIKAICISASSMLKVTTEPIPPCGACRQSLLEYENKQNEVIPVYFTGKVGEIIQSPSIKNLLPFIFKENSL